MTTAQIIGELMAKYTTLRNKWIATFGKVDGFDAWFTKRVHQKEPRK